MQRENTLDELAERWARENGMHHNTRYYGNNVWGLKAMVPASATKDFDAEAWDDGVFDHARAFTNTRDAVRPVVMTFSPYRNMWAWQLQRYVERDLSQVGQIAEQLGLQYRIGNPEDATYETPSGYPLVPIKFWRA